nr:putative reverse transcriptase domain-containing protein [Tanacetum cinerariifolium]
IIMENVPPNDPNFDASAIVPAPVNPDQGQAQPVGPEEEEEDPKEDPKEDPEEDPEEDDDDVMEMDDEADVMDPYMDDGSNNQPPPNFKDEETPPTSPVIPDVDGCDNIEMDRAVRNVMSDLSGLKKLVKGLSDRFDEYEGCKVFKDKKVLEKELYEESFPFPLGSQVREPPVEPSARPVPPLHHDYPYVVTRDSAATVATSSIDDDNDDDVEKDEEDMEEEEHPSPAEPSDVSTDDLVMEMDDDAEVIDPYMDDGSNNPPPLNSEDEEIPPTSPVILDAEGQPIPPIASFGQNFHFGDSSSTANLLTGNSKFVSTGPMCLNLGMAWRRLGKMEKLMLERIDTEGRMKKKFKEKDHHFTGLGCDNIKMDRAVRNVMLDLFGLKKLVKGLSDQFDEEPPTEPSPRPVPALHPDDPYIVTRDTTAAVAVAVATFGIDDDDDTTPMDSQPYEPHFMKCSPITFRGNKGAVGLIRWTEKTEMVFTVSKCIKANKVVFPAATFQDRALTWWNSQVATLGMEAMTRKTWAKMKVMTEKFCPPDEIQRM